MFRGAEFLSYDLSHTGGEPIVSAQDSVTFYFKTRQPNGLLFYTGDDLGDVTEFNSEREGDKGDGVQFRHDKGKPLAVPSV